MNEQLVDILLRVSYVFGFIAIAGILVFTIIQMVQHFKESLPSLAGMVGLVILFLIAYSSASGVAGRGDFSEDMVKLVSGGLFTCYVLGSVSIIGIIIGEIWNSIK